ncbi:MAG: TIGR02453 family protein [Terrimonas sp.]|nr:TIGR02453 family protein [Terrimonas sp.]
MIQASTLRFLKELKKNNHKAWFDENRKRYEAAKKDFEVFIQAIIDRHSQKDPSLAGLMAKNCMFRINRDIRFSKDKSPYKTNFGASINRGGKKAMTAGYYFHLEPGGAFAGGGIYQPMPGELQQLRQEIDYNFADFKKIISSKKFKSTYGQLDKSPEFSLTRIPKGYEAENPAAEYLKLKSYIAMVSFSDKELQSKELVIKTVQAFEALQPLIDFINKGLE